MRKGNTEGGDMTYERPFIEERQDLTAQLAKGLITSQVD
jgi:hypothetical protein